MRVCNQLKNLTLFIVCVCLSVLYIIFKSNSIETNNSKTDSNIYQNYIISDRSNDYLISESPKWQVLTDGTVIHLGNSSDNSYNNISFLINNEKICENFIESENSIKVIIFIESEAINFKRRQTIRETWAQKLLQKALNFKIIYLLGLHPNKAQSFEIQDKIQSENLLFGDIIQIDVMEDFNNLTLKSIASLKWFLDYCPKADFYFKTDDDILIHPINLMEALKQFGSNDKSIICHKNKSRKIIRNFEIVSDIMRSHRYSNNRFELIKNLKKKILKYKINFSQLPGIYFPHYCSGFGYGFTAPVAQRLYSTALTIPYFLIEDVFITGFCRQKANIDIKDTQFLTLRPELRPSEGICAFNGGRINANEMSVRDIRDLWLNINTQRVCPTKRINR